MSPKKNKGKRARETEDPKKPPAFQKSMVMCSSHGPGPKYKLKPVVGYDDHCASRYRGPAYSIAARQTGELYSDGPGPIYYVELPKAGGFTIGRPQRGEETAECRPGPYLLPDPPRSPAFSMKWRTPLRGGATCAGPYDLPSSLNGPAFSITPKGDGTDCVGGPGPSPPFSIDPVKPRAPAYSIAFRQTDKGLCGGPGPYYPKNLDTSPAFSLGIKHNPCISPNITECDDIC